MAPIPTTMSSNDKHKKRNNNLAQYSKVPTDEYLEERQGLLSDDANAGASGNVDLPEPCRRFRFTRKVAFLVG